jgi:hypothetical protein
MKTSIILVLALLMQTVFCISKLHAQCNPGFFKTPEELVRNRLTGNDQIYGHPYTMFNKRYDNFNLDNEIDYIRREISREWDNYVNNPDNGKGIVLSTYGTILAFANTPRPVDVPSVVADVPSVTGYCNQMHKLFKYNPNQSACVNS